MSFYFIPGDEAIARVQAHQFVKILSDFTREEIDAAADQYAATVTNVAPNPAKIVALIEAARSENAQQEAEQEKWARERREHEEDIARRKQRVTPEAANRITQEFNRTIAKRGG